MPPPERADFAQASAIFERAIRVGTREEDWDAVARGWTGLGAVQRRAGNRDDAAAAYMQALATARRHGLEHREGEAFHHLAVIAFERGRPHDGILFARRALDACEDDRHRVAVLATDLARHWMDDEHAFGRALPSSNGCCTSPANPRAASSCSGTSRAPPRAPVTRRRSRAPVRR